MYQTSSHEPRYKRSTRDREPRHVESWKPSEGSTSEEEENSTDRSTEDSDDSQGSESFLKERECDGRDGIFQHVTYIRSNKPGKCLKNRCIGSKNNKVLKKDKITQKNLLSPFPSFTMPIYRELTHYRPPTVRPSLEEQKMMRKSGKPPRYVLKEKDIFEEHDTNCVLHRKERKTCEKPKSQKASLRPQSSKCVRPERVLTCLPNERTPDSLELKYPIKPGKFSMRTFTSTVGDERRTDREHSIACRVPDTRVFSGWRPEEDPITRDYRTRHSQECSAEGGTEGKGTVREKLVYVVEEKGKDTTKVETDLFTINEILAIKKDLVELSEFAKKLKRLKEMKRESEKGKNQQNFCHCKPAAKLLRDVNKRIEALEARQEELERGTKFLQKPEVEIDSKENQKTPTAFQSKTPEITRASAMTSVPSFPKTDVFVSRAEAFSNNSDIVNELMDIKTQLQILEKKRMLKKSSEAVAPAGDRPILREDRTIAVFSSSTYILTLENLTKKKEDAKTDKKEEEKANSYMPSAEDKARCEETKAQVVNWLKNVSPKTGEKEENPFPDSKDERRKDISSADMKQAPDIRCKTCDQVLKKDLENQEPQKNRAPKAETGQGDSSLEVEPFKKQPPKFKECYVTASGRIFARLSKSSEMEPLPVFFCDKIERLRKKSPSKGMMSHKVSSCSIPSVLLTKKEIQNMKSKASKNRFVRVIRSKSLQMVSESSTVSKIEKTARNKNLKNLENKKSPSLQKDKKRKEDKNEFMKRIEAQFLALTKSLVRGQASSSAGSEFMASVNLEKDTSETTGTNEFQDSTGNTTVATYVAGVEQCNLFDETLEPQSGEEPCYTSRKTEKERRKRSKSKEKKQKEKRKKLEKKYREERKKRERELKHRKKRSSSEEKRRKKEALLESKKQRKRCSSEEKRRKREEKKAKKKRQQCTCQKCQRRTRLVKRIPSGCICGVECRHRIVSKCVPPRIHRREDCCLKKTLKENDSQEYLSVCIAPTASTEDVSHDRKCTKVTQLEKKKQEGLISDDCALKYVLKNLGRFYPKEAPRHKTFKSDKDSEYHSHCESQKHRHHHHHHRDHPFQKEGCRCVRAYVQTQSQPLRGWSGLRPFKENTGTESERLSSRTERSNGSQNFVFSKPNPQVFYTESPRRRRKKDKNKEKHKKHKHKKCTKDKNANNEDDNFCKCKKCGNVHHIDEKPDEKEDFERDKKTENEHDQPSSEERPTNRESKVNYRKGDAFPLFSFLSHFCKTKPKEELTRKISEVRYLKVCNNVKSNRSSISKKCFRLKKKNYPRQKKTESEVCELKKCCCDPKLEKIESRLSQLENKINCKKKNESKRKKKCDESEDSEPSEPSDMPEKKHKKHRQKRHKKKCKKKKDFETNSDSPGSDNTEKKKKCKKKKQCETPEPSEASYDREKKKGKKHKKKKKGKCDEETLAYYHILKPRCPEETPNDSATKSSKTTTTTTTTTTTATTTTPTEEKEDAKDGEPSTTESKSEEHVKEKKCRKLRETLSSFPSFWRNLNVKKMSAGRLEALVNKIRRKNHEEQEEGFSYLDDCSKSSPMPKGQEVVEMKQEPNVFMKKLRKMKKRKGDKREEKKEKKARKKEARSVKSKSKMKRHV